MIVWTIQPYKVYQEILSIGRFCCNPKRSTNLKNDVNFSHAYRWMIKQMITKIGPAEKKECYPVWAWYRSHDYKHQRPDFRWNRDYEDEVCIELKILENCALLSDFEGWHFVLNDGFYSDTKNESEWELQDKQFENLPKEERQQVKEASWQKIFDITPRHGKWDKNGDSVQACFWSIEKEQICKVW